MDSSQFPSQVTKLRSTEQGAPWEGVNPSLPYLSDSISVMEDWDAYIVEGDTGVKNKLTYRARRDRIDEFLYRLANNPYKELNNKL